MANCENCGIPQGACSHPGYTLTLQFMPQIGQKWTRQQKRTVWTCNSACAVQTMAIAAMGLPTHKWHMTLAEFISQMKAAGKLDFLADGKRYKPPSQTRINSGDQKSENEKLILGHAEEFVTPKPSRKGGRPSLENPNANVLRQRRHRQRHPTP